MIAESYLRVPSLQGSSQASRIPIWKTNLMKRLARGSKREQTLKGSRMTLRNWIQLSQISKTHNQLRPAAQLRHAECSWIDAKIAGHKTESVYSTLQNEIKYQHLLVRIFFNYLQIAKTLQRITENTKLLSEWTLQVISISHYVRRTFILRNTRTCRFFIFSYVIFSENHTPGFYSRFILIPTFILSHCIQPESVSFS